MSERTPKQIVKEVQDTVLRDKRRMIDEEGYYHPTLHVSSSIRRLIKEFEEMTGKDWDEAAKDYL